jgi:transposase
MAWFRVHLTAEQQRIVNEERVAHPDLRVREKMLVLWLLHCGAKREEAAKIVGVSRTTVHRYMAAYRDLIRESFEKRPVHTIAQACDRIFELTGLRRGPSQVRKFLKDMGLKFQRVRVIPVPPKKSWPSMSRPKPLFSTPS